MVASKVVVIIVEKELHRQLKFLALKENRSLKQVVERLIRRGMKSD